jgi:hypothetical protein
VQIEHPQESSGPMETQGNPDAESRGGDMHKQGDCSPTGKNREIGYDKKIASRTDKAQGILDRQGNGLANKILPDRVQF